MSCNETEPLSMDLPGHAPRPTACDPAVTIIMAHSQDAHRITIHHRRA